MSVWLLVFVAVAAIEFAVRAHLERGGPEAVRRRRVELAQSRMAHKQWELAYVILEHIGDDVTGPGIPDVGCLRAQCLLELDRAREALERLRPLVAAPAVKPADTAQRWHWFGEAQN